MVFWTIEKDLGALHSEVQITVEKPPEKHLGKSMEKTHLI